MRWRKLSCSFCRRTDAEVEQLVAGPWRIIGRVYICDRCAAQTIAIMEDRTAGPALPAASSDGDLQANAPRERADLGGRARHELRVQLPAAG